MRIGVPPSSENCLEAVDFLVFMSEPGAMRVPKPAAGIMATTFIAGCKYTGWREAVQMLCLCESSFSFGSQFNAIAVWMHDPCKAAVVIIFPVWIGLDRLGF